MRGRIKAEWLGRNAVIAGAFAGAAMVISGCYSLTEGSLVEARDQFSKNFQCPPERVTVSIEPVTVNPPPADVAADPARLAMYNQQVAQQLQTNQVIAAAGCGQRAMFNCFDIYSRHAGDQTGCAMIERGKLGVSIVAPTRTIDGVAPGGLGERLGFRVGDVYVALDHQPITDMADCVQRINDPKSPGHVLTMSRGGQQVDISVPRLGD